MEGVADYSGWINKLSAKGFWKGSWKRKWAMLQGESLYLYKSPSDSKTSRCVHLNDYTAVKRATHKTRQFCVELVHSSNPQKSLCFQFDSKEEMRKWVALLRAAVKDKAIDLSLADKTGWLAVLGGKKMTKTWKTRWVVAQYSTLYLFKDETSAAKQPPSLIIDLTECTKATVVDSSRSGRPNAFHITTNRASGETHFLAALSETDLRDWLNFISPLLQTNKEDGDIRADLTDENNFFVAPADSHFAIPSPTRPDFRILPLDNGHFLTAWKELLLGHDPEGVETWRISGWGRVVATSPDHSLIVATCGKVRQWAIFEAVAGEMVGNPVEHTEWLYSLAWLSSSRYIAASSLSTLYVFSVDGRLLKSWTKLKPTGGLVEVSSLRKIGSSGKPLSSSVDFDADDGGYSMHVHCVAAMRGDLVAVSEPSSNAVWIADLQRGLILQTIEFDSPLDLTVTREGRTMLLGVDGRRHIGMITIYRHHASKSLESEPPVRLNRATTISTTQLKYNTWSYDKGSRTSTVVLNPLGSSGGLGKQLKSTSDVAISSKQLNSSTDEPKKSSEVFKLPLPGGEGVHMIGNDSTIAWKPLVHISPSHRYMLVNDRTGLLWLVSTSTGPGGPPRHLGRSILGYVHDVLWLSDEAFLAITNNRTLFKVDLLLDAVVFSRCIL